MEPNQLLRENPGAPPAMPQSAPQPAPPSTTELTTGLHQTAYLNAALKGLLSRKEPPTRKDVFDMASDLVDKGVLTPQKIAAELATMPSNPEMLKPWLFTHWLVSEQHLDQLSQMIHGADVQQPAQQQMPAEAMPGQAMPGQPEPPPANALMPNG